MLIIFAAAKVRILRLGNGHQLFAQWNFFYRFGKNLKIHADMLANSFGHVDNLIN